LLRRAILRCTARRALWNKDPSISLLTEKEWEIVRYFAWLDLCTRTIDYHMQRQVSRLLRLFEGQGSFLRHESSRNEERGGQMGRVAFLAGGCQPSNGPVRERRFAPLREACKPQKATFRPCQLFICPLVEWFHGCSRGGSFGWRGRGGSPVW
jgi:hypothetical protein